MTGPATLLDELGLRFSPSFFRDKLLYVAILCAPVPVLIIKAVQPSWEHGYALSIMLLVSLVLWQPLLEEVFFRGVVQGQLNRYFRYRCMVAGLTIANLVTTLMFSLAHLVYQPAPWAIAVMVPSLIFGYFRDRHHQIYPALLLHAVYNALYLYLGLADR